jgi:hypothetical protein
MRSILVRALEWRARSFSDPADRLQFLRRKVADLEGGSRDERRCGTRQYVRQIARVSVITITLLLMLANTDTIAEMPSPANLPQRENAGEAAGPVWLVQTNQQFDLYSNGLRIEEQYATSTAPRRYIAFANDASRPGPGRPGPGAASWRTEPAGIVYHTTESHISPFEEHQNRWLRRDGEGVLEYVSRRRSYHFVIDRFGRVFRIVRESDYANHAGNSVWADPLWLYVNLNQSFFGIAFEARSKSAGNGAPVNSAQVYAGRILTEMLRARYGIHAFNCVAHAQVSINPDNHGVGYHVDWAANLPFDALGLADNYKLPLPSVTQFGFRADATLLEAGPGSMVEGLNAAEAQLRVDAAAQSLPVELYRDKLHKRYRDAIRALRGKGAYQEYN